MPERFRGDEFLTTMGRYTNLCTFTFTYNCTKKAEAVETRLDARVSYWSPNGH